MKEMKLSAIYQADGKTLEYAELALNPYTGCSHNCSYCYNKREGRPQGPYDQPAKKASLKNIQHDLLMLERDHDRRPVHISFMCDPYDMGRANNSHIRDILMAFRAYDHPFQILTKGGMLAAKDFDLYGHDDSFGVTLTFDNDADSRRFEPGAALPKDRIAALLEAHSRNIHTWVSCEPVLYPAQTLKLIEMTHEFVDLFWVGKLTHYPKMEEKIDWPKFRSEAEALLQKCGKEKGTGYKLLHQLIEAK